MWITVGLCLLRAICILHGTNLLFMPVIIDTFFIPPTNRIMAPPAGYLTMYVGFFSYSLYMPLHLLLVEIYMSLGLCRSQLTHNALLLFMGFYEEFAKHHLSISMDSFYAFSQLAMSHRALHSFTSHHGMSASF